jgi:hypothetical protein
MTEPFGRPSNEHKIVIESGSIEDDASDMTPPVARNVKRNHHSVVEKTVKFRFSPKDRAEDPIHPSVVHIQWINAIQEALGTDIELYDNKGKALPKIDPLRWTKEQHSKIYNLHIQGTKESFKSKQLTGRETTVFIVHRIRTAWSLTDIKQIPSISKLLREHKVFLTDHRWQETVWNTTQLGFFVGLDPVFFDSDQAMAKVTHEITESLEGRKKIPSFRMAFVTPSAMSGDRSVRTKAYAIETVKSSSEELLRLIKKTYKTSGSFIPFQMRSKHPEAFVRAISMQTQTLSTNRTIVLNNIGTEAMMYLSHWIEQIEGVEEIVPYKTVEVDGRYRILTKLKEFQRIRNHIMVQLPQWYEDHVAPDAQPRFGRFPGDPEVAPIKSDSYSDDSYMASSINTLMGFDKTMFAEPPQAKEKPNVKYQNHLQRAIPAQVQHPLSWADQVKHGQSSKQALTSESDRSDSAQVRKDLQSKIAEVNDLKLELESLRMEKAQYQEEIKRQVQEQVNTVIQDYLDKNSGPTGVTQNQFETFLELQNKNFGT